MSLQHTIDTFEARDASPSRAGSERYWAPCLAVALVAMSLFYVTLKDLVHESAARAPASPPAVMPAYVEATQSAGRLGLPDSVKRSSVEPAMPVFHRAAPANTNLEASVEPAKAAPAVTVVSKCVMPEGDAIYSDGPCPAGASASTLRLPRDLHASASQ
ncbi:hypothetical protein J2W32_003397 [Variovorax boronicumulans]|uniref:Energy transducer TonB n=1 Tax=Variovorax boronicumulans TaxID=436515 RepID=A0AAW8D3S3_9BURK|nr:hypothetical protein [Variovorax boronicumulans]MDP9894521.1 hypothetical protein [Variovorax boronicumulans]MDQ0054340.1 hypothetical protein [Variovorax boronicumulans]